MFSDQVVKPAMHWLLSAFVRCCAPLHIAHCQDCLLCAWCQRASQRTSLLVPLRIPLPSHPLWASGHRKSRTALPPVRIQDGQAALLPPTIGTFRLTCPARICPASPVLATGAVGAPVPPSLEHISIPSGATLQEFPCTASISSSSSGCQDLPVPGGR